MVIIWFLAKVFRSKRVKRSVILNRFFNRFTLSWVKHVYIRWSHNLLSWRPLHRLWSQLSGGRNVCCRPIISVLYYRNNLLLIFAILIICHLNRFFQIISFLKHTSRLDWTQIKNFGFSIILFQNSCIYLDNFSVISYCFIYC